MTALVWFRRDLRLHDHPALHAAASSSKDGAVVPVFCFDPGLLEGRHRSGPRTRFLLECLSELDSALKQRGSKLVVRFGRPEVEIPSVASQCRARCVHVTADASPFATRRDGRVAAALFGCISARALEHRLPPGSGAEAFARQLGWRDFYAHVLLARPANAHTEYSERYRGSLKWSRSRKAFDAWCQGQTGYPLVDAGMRELLREGWMHNRVRMVVGSFLTKHLGIDWRWGERWFMRMLLDGDEASNNGNWQWIASVGVDPQPPYRRIYNPARQQQRFDPDGSYVRAHVPELRDVPDRYLAEPWTMSSDTQRDAACVIGTDYPAPIVDHASARREALDRYAAAADAR